MPTIINLRSRKIVQNRIFLAYQWYTYREKYERACNVLHQSYPVYFYAIGRPKGQPAETLLGKIESVLYSSSQAVFDASKGNANVSLEYGLARHIPNMKKHLFIDSTSVPTGTTPGTPIISDLAGTTANRWELDKLNTLISHLKAIAERHPYTKRFRAYCRRQRLRGGQIKRTMMVIRLFDEEDSILRSEALDLLGDRFKGSKRSEIVDLLTKMHSSELIKISRGNPSKISIT